MTFLPVIFRVQANYQNDDLSRYRTAMMMNTLVVSLQNQKDQDFKVVIEQDPADKQNEKREEAFAKWLMDPQVPVVFRRIEVEVPDDDFLAPEFVSKIKQVRIDPKMTENCFITVPNGFCLHEGKLRNFRNQPDRLFVSVVMVHGEHPHKTMDGPTDPLWIHVRHSHSDLMETPEMTRGNAIYSLNWPGWKQELVARYAEVQLKSATSAGVTVQFPRRVVYAGKRQKSKRGKRS